MSLFSYLQSTFSTVYLVLLNRVWEGLNEVSRVLTNKLPPASFDQQPLGYQSMSQACGSLVIFKLTLVNVLIDVLT